MITGLADEPSKPRRGVATTEEGLELPTHERWEGSVVSGYLSE